MIEGTKETIYSSYSPHVGVCVGPVIAPSFTNTLILARPFTALEGTVKVPVEVCGPTIVACVNTCSPASVNKPFPLKSIQTDMAFPKEPPCVILETDRL